ncbi:urea active transporter [Eremomyces bilateralis CBS 781.70]|uniref:Urea active transporter n=1 Tax=Eremomyces bilateralis CBS 781.70 TaxID=1392243 RepID=A0A6G1G6V7_9PEZI|nr:urea active transporter [Eremomyces bilateralis CBS 781.70]KAF1813691.1 urea active transporter [Eremomyces bilateralis CBS 781.70]
MAEPPLSQGVGYGVVIGLGFLFAFGMILTTFVLKRYNYELQTSEMFSTAGRTVKSGLVASAVVSSWTWAATLLQSSGVAYKYGVSGPFWYASGATVQIILFATLAIELKRRAPNAHTFLEVIRARYGKVTHFVYITFGLMTNILVTSMLLTGGSAVVTSLTGVPTAAACFLLPIGVVLYTMFGGIKATFLTDYAHTVVILVIIMTFAFTTYATSDVLGSPGKVWEILVEKGKEFPVEGNEGGSYLTMRSREGAIFFVINIVGNFGTVFMDNGYYNKAIAAHPVHALPGYVLGGLSWFAIPWLAATTMGLAALALEGHSSFPTYPDRLPAADVNAGLVLPSAAVALLGKGGAAATLLLIFMAVTSAMSAELIAVSSIATYDIYQTYINPAASGKRLIYSAHMCVVAYAFLMAAFSTGLYYAGISMGYLYLLMGVIIGAAVLPAALTLLWSQQNWWAATLAPPLGLVCALIGWLVQAKQEFGTLTVDSTGANNPMLVGNVVALISPMIFIPVLTYALGTQKYDWQSMKEIRRADDHDLADAAHIDLELIPGGRRESIAKTEEEQVKLAKAAKFARILTVTLTLSMLVLWPMPMYGSGYIFSKKFFTGWVVVGMIWIFFSTVCVGLYPLYEGRGTMARTAKAVYLDLTGKKKPTPVHGQVVEETGTSTPTEKVAPEKTG